MLCCRSLVTKHVTKLAAFQRQHCKNVHTCSAKFSKLFQENENEHAFSVLESSREIADMSSYIFRSALPKSPALQEVENFNLSTLNGLLNVTDVPIEELHERFILITKLIKDAETNIEEPRFNSLIQNIVKALPKMTVDQIADVLTALKYWSSTGSIRSRNFLALWNALDSQCVSRCETWTYEQLIKIANLWFQLGLSRMTMYNSKMIAMLSKEIKELSAQTVVQLLFFINLQRIRMAASLAAEIEKKLIENVEHLTLDELGVAALGFFKTQTPLKSEKFVMHIIAKIKEQPDDINEMTLAALLKLVRFSTTFNTVGLCRDLQSVFIQKVDHFQPSTLTHIILLVAHYLVCHSELLTKVVLRLSNDIHSVRLKELSKSIYCLAIFKSSTPFHQDVLIDFTNKLIEELRIPERQKEIEEYPVNFVSIVLSLAYLDIFPEDLINKCLNEKFITLAQQSRTNIDVSRELAVIDSSVEIECPWYKGNRLRDAKERISKKTIKALSDSHQDRMIQDICESIKDVFDITESKYLQICHILPHFQSPDILFILDESGSVIPIPVHAKHLRGDIIRPNTKDKWFAVVGGGRSFYQRDHRKATGVSEMKLRQLKKLGYNVMEVPWFIYTSLHRGVKTKYIKTKISECFNSSN